MFVITLNHRRRTWLNQAALKTGLDHGRID
jgi:hypothetical protein